MTLIIISAIAIAVSIIIIIIHNIHKQQRVVALESKMAEEPKALRNVINKFALLDDTKELQGVRYAMYVIKW